MTNSEKNPAPLRDNVCGRLASGVLRNACAGDFQSDRNGRRNENTLQRVFRGRRGYCVRGASGRRDRGRRVRYARIRRGAYIRRLAPRRYQAQIQGLLRVQTSEKREETQFRLSLNRRLNLLYSLFLTTTYNIITRGGYRNSRYPPFFVIFREYRKFVCKSIQYML